MATPSARPIVFSLLWFFFVVGALANTEIAVERLPLQLSTLEGDAQATSVTGVLPLLEQRHHTLSLINKPEPLESSLLVPLELIYAPSSHLARFFSHLEQRFGLETVTARLSWPASMPTDFHLSFQSAPPSSVHPTLPHLLIRAKPSFVSSPSANATSTKVHFALVVEPVHLGFLPHSAAPVVALLVGVAVFLYVTGLPGRVVHALEAIARAGIEDEPAERKKL